MGDSDTGNDDGLWFQSPGCGDSPWSQGPPPKDNQGGDDLVVLSAHIINIIHLVVCTGPMSTE